MASTTNASLASEAAAYLRESARAVGGFCGIQSEIRRQAGFLVEWARKKGVLLTDSCTEGLTKYERDTLEHVVYFGSPGERVIKCTKPGKFGFGHGKNGKYGRHPDATPLFYLQRLDLMNQVFLTDLRLEGIALCKPDFGKGGDSSPYMVTSQRFYEKADEESQHPTEEEIKAFMKRLDFKLLQDSCYNWIRESDRVVVTDAKMLNFINTAEGIIPIDVVISIDQPIEPT